MTDVTSEYATATPTTGNSIADHRVYWRVSALALAAVALLGLIVNAIGGNDAYIPDVASMEGFLVFDWTHDIVHVLLAAIAFAFGFTALRTRPVAKTMAGVVGVVYLGLGVLGFFPPVVESLHGLLGLHLELGENLIHLLLGAWGAYAGFSG